MEFTLETYDALNRYFTALSHTGYKPYSEVNKLLIMVFLEELLCGPMNEYITEEDYGYISRAKECLYGSCMIPYPTYKIQNDKVFGSSACCINS